MAAARTPLYADHVAAGARMVDFAGWEMPVQYVGIREEHLAVREGVGVFDVSHMGQVLVHGPGALEAVQWLSSRDATALSDGEAQYGVLCNEAGGIVDDIFVYRLSPEQYLIVVNASNRTKDLAWMRANLRGDATIDDLSDDWALLAVQGPGAEAALAPLVTGLDLSTLPARGFGAVAFAGIEGCLVARTGYTGEDGFEVFVPATEARAAWAAVTGAGAVPCGLGARDTLRLEVRNPLYGHELDDTTSPFQAGIGFAVDLDKPGGFLGADALRARKGKEPQRLAAIVLDGKRVPRDGMSVVSGDEVVGRVTSGTRSPSVDKSICLAYLRADLCKPGTRVAVDVRGKSEPGEVVRGAFYVSNRNRSQP